MHPYTIFPPQRSCPLCDKPLFYAPRAPEDTAKMACADPECENAHGIVNWLDFRREAPVKYNETPTPQKENTVTTLSQAHSLANNITAAQNQFENYIRSSLQDYLDFLPQRGSKWVTHYKNANYFTFTELDGRNFLFESDEYSAYGDYTNDHVSLPFDFVEAPEKYKATILAQIKSAEDKKQARIKATHEEKVAKLRDQLAAAEADLAKATKNNDPISTIATRNQAQKLRDDLAKSATPEKG